MADSTCSLTALVWELDSEKIKAAADEGQAARLKKRLYVLGKVPANELGFLEIVGAHARVSQW